MSSSDKSSLRITADSPAVELEVFDVGLSHVAHAFGGLEQELDPGIYQVRYRAGSEVRESLIALKPGEQRVLELSVPFPAVAPVPGSSTWTKGHEEGLRSLLANIPPGDHNGEITIFLRTLTPEGMNLGPKVFSQLSIRDAKMQPVTGVEFMGSYDQEEKWAGLRVSVEPGGYVLRVSAPLDPDAVHTQFPTSRELDQSVWVSPGWNTVVFIPHRRYGPASACASVHMLPINRSGNVPQRPLGSGALALEAATEALRQGRRAVSWGVKDLVGAGPAVNPMLALVSAHTTLLATSPDWAFFDALLDPLHTTIPDHPDVVALLAIAEGRHLTSSPSRSAEPPDTTLPSGAPSIIAWPPMLVASYRILLRHDARVPERPAILAHSAAEQVTARLVTSGMWSIWEPLERASSLDALVGVVQASVRPAVQSAKPALIDIFLSWIGSGVTNRNWKRMIETIPAGDATSARVRAYLTELVTRTRATNLREFLRSIDMGELSLAIGLPRAAVQRSLDRIVVVLGGTPSSESYNSDPGSMLKLDESLEDPWKSRFGGRASTWDRKLVARVAPLDDRQELCEITLQVQSARWGKSLSDEAVVFYLHPTFPNPTPEVPVRDGVATLKLTAWGAFTVGAVADGGRTRLELDLAEHPDAPAWFKAR